MFDSVLKRDGRKVKYDNSKIANAIFKAMQSCNRNERAEAERLAKLAEESLIEKFSDKTPTIENIQDTVEDVLMNNGYANVARKYIIYRAERTKAREMNTPLMKIIDELTFSDANDSDMKRDNANIDGDTAMGIMLKYGSEAAKNFYERCILTQEQARAHESGDIHIHDLDFYTLTTTCCQIDLVKLFEKGFCTGHGFLREPNDIQSYSALACIAIQSNQNDQHGGQSVPNFDYALSKGVVKTYKKLYMSNFYKAAKLICDGFKLTQSGVSEIIKNIEKTHGVFPSLYKRPEYYNQETKAFAEYLTKPQLKKVRNFAETQAEAETEKATYQAMEALVHNLNTMHSRAGAQTPFSSINYGTDTTLEGRMVTRNVLLATEAGLGFGETPIFPIHVFKIKDGVNYYPTDPNFDLFQLALRVTSKRLFPNFSFIDAPFNKLLYKEGRPETEVAYMGCRTRVLANNYDPGNEISYGRGNLSFTSINLPRIAINAKGNVEWFFEDLERKLDLVKKQLLDRFAIQKKKKVKNFPFLMGQGIWLGSENLSSDDEVGEILKHGTLSIGFIGLAEALKALIGSHHGETLKAKNLGLEIVGFMREYCDKASKEHKLNFTLLATPAEGLSGRFVKKDAKKFGKIKDVTDREYYTNSFHIPVYFKISAIDKIKIEAPYHALTNAGHISYVELDGDASKNVEALYKIIMAMHDAGIGYGSINHPVDRDPVCGYSGLIGDTCPKCQRTEEFGPKFERIRRITGYLVGTLDRFNDAKKAEERERVKHI
jgi:ribonucleoside-triphosphate reductase